MPAIRTKQDLIGRLRRHRDDLRQLGVQRLGLFGSFQRGEPDVESDVDLLVDFAPGEKSFDKLYGRFVFVGGCTGAVSGIGNA